MTLSNYTEFINQMLRCGCVLLIEFKGQIPLMTTNKRSDRRNKNWKFSGDRLIQLTWRPKAYILQFWVTE